MTIVALSIVFSLVYYGFTFWVIKDIHISTKDICICGLIIALTMILDSIRVPLPTGATMAMFSPVPIFLLAILWDKRLAMISGFVCGVLAIFLIPVWQIVHWSHPIITHLVAFSCLGYAGIFGTNHRWRIACGMALASVIKIMAHFLSGAIFFGSYAWEGWSPWAYSLVYNISQNIPLCLLSSLIVLALPLQTMNRAIASNGRKGEQK